MSTPINEEMIVRKWTPKRPRVTALQAPLHAESLLPVLTSVAGADGPDSAECATKTTTEREKPRVSRVLLILAAAATGLWLLTIGPAAQGRLDGERPSLESQVYVPPPVDDESPVVDGEPPVPEDDEAAAIEGLAVFNTGLAACLTVDSGDVGGVSDVGGVEALLTQADCDRSPEQAWVFDDSGRLLNRNDTVERCVVVAGASGDHPGAGAALGVAQCDVGEPDSWLAQSLGDGTMRIHSSDDPSMCIDGAMGYTNKPVLVACRADVQHPDTQAFDLVSLDTEAGRTLVDAAQPTTQEPDRPVSEVVDRDLSLDGGGLSLADLDGRVLRVLDHEFGQVSLLGRGQRLVHIPTSEDYERCLEYSGLEPVVVLADDLAATGWPIDWRYQERCPGPITRLSPRDQ